MSEYRTTAHVCPECAGVMTETATAQALLDLCPDCGGLWIDWSDGDLQQMAQRVAAVRT